MKILIFTNSLAGGGAERVAATLANYWALRHWDVTVLTLNPISEDFYRLDPAVRRLSLNLAGDSGSMLNGLLQNARRVAALRRCIRQIRPEFALSMMSTPNVLLAFASCGISAMRTIGSERCYPAHAPLGTLWNALRRRMYGRLSAVVALTHDCAEWIETHSSASRVAVIPNAAVWPLPDSPPRISPASICVPERKILLAVGRLDSVKNHEVLIQAFAPLAKTYPEWDLVILGEGPERLLLESAIRDTLLGGRVFMPGMAGNVGEWYLRANLFVMTSRSEGFPNALAEALSHGLPAVSFDCKTGPRDIIRHGVDGLLVPADDAIALVDALDRLLGDTALRTRLAARAHDARSRFSIETIAGMWEALFKELSGAPVRSRLARNGRASKRGGP